MTNPQLKERFGKILQKRIVSEEWQSTCVMIISEPREENWKMNKLFWLHLAEVVDAWRVVPRLLVLVCVVGYTLYFVDSYLWIKEIYEAKETVPGSVAGYVGGTLSALGGVLTLLINKYFSSGRKWTDG